MSDIAVSVQSVSKLYRLGVIGGGTLHGDLSRWWAHVRHRPDPSLRIGQESPDGQNKGYIWALESVDLDVHEGEVIGIIGRNGAGKSTLLKILARVTAPTEGFVGIKGHIASLLEVGTGFHPELTGRENIFLNGAMLGMSRARTRKQLDDIVEFAEIQQFLDTPVKRYSSGMYVRLAFAVAAHLDAEVHLMDEVLAVGDVEFQKKSLGKMGDVAASGRTVLFVSHNMGAISRICTTSVLIDGGRVKRKGATHEVVSAYLSAGMQESGGVVDFDDRGGDAQVRQAWFQLEDGTRTNRIPVTSEFELCILYVVRRSAKGLTVAVSVADSHGSMIFYSEAESLCVSRGNGTYVSSVRFPSHFLAPGQFSVTLDLHVPNVVVLDQRAHAMSFEIVETGSDAFTYAGTDVGSILVDLDWEQRREDNGDHARAKEGHGE